MSKPTLVRKSFNAGELSPELWYRDDLAAHSKGCKHLENFTATPYGAVARRPPMKLLAAIDDTFYGVPVKYIPFKFSLTEVFHFVFTDGSGTAGVDPTTADLVIFDGECVFCTAQVKNLKRFDGKNRLAFVSLHDKFVTDRFPDLSHEQMMEQIYIIPNSKTGYTDRRYGGADAVRYLTRRLPKLWILAPLFHIPFTRTFQQWCYRQIAKRRYKIAGRHCEDDACKVHFD